MALGPEERAAALKRVMELLKGVDVKEFLKLVIDLVMDAMDEDDVPAEDED